MLGLYWFCYNSLTLKKKKKESTSQSGDSKFTSKQRLTDGIEHGIYRVGTGFSAVIAMASLNYMAQHMSELYDPATIHDSSKLTPPFVFITSAILATVFYAMDKDVGTERVSIKETSNAELTGITAESDKLKPRQAEVILFRGERYSLVRECKRTEIDSQFVPTDIAIPLLKDESTKRG